MHTSLLIIPPALKHTLIIIIFITMFRKNTVITHADCNNIMNPTLLTYTTTTKFTIINYRNISSPLTVKAAQTALVYFLSYQKKKKCIEIIIIPTARQNMSCKSKSNNLLFPVKSLAIISH